jgi:hypothetical protein
VARSDDRDADGRKRSREILERKFRQPRARIYKGNKRAVSMKQEAEDIKGSEKLHWSRRNSVSA